LFYFDKPGHVYCYSQASFGVVHDYTTKMQISLLPLYRLIKGLKKK